MLDTLFGNRTAAKVLMFLSINRDAYAQEIANRTGISLGLVQSQLRRLESGGILVSRPRGRMRFYSFSPRVPFREQFEDMLRAFLDFMPETEQDIYNVRQRPRAPGKTL